MVVVVLLVLDHGENALDDHHAQFDRGEAPRPPRIWIGRLLNISELGNRGRTRPEINLPGIRVGRRFYRPSLCAAASAGGIESREVARIAARITRIFASPEFYFQVRLSRGLWGVHLVGFRSPLLTR